MAGRPPFSPGPNVPGALPWLRWTQTLNQGSKYSITPFLGDDVALKEHLADVDEFEKEIFVLDRLQHAKAAEFSASTLQILLNSFRAELPQSVQDQFGLDLGRDYGDPDTGPVIGQQVWFTQDDESFQNTLELFRKEMVVPLDNDNKEFIFWVVDTGNPSFDPPAEYNWSSYFVTIVLHYGPSDPSKPEVLDRITDWAIVGGRDVAQTDVDNIERTASRLQELLRDQIEGAVRREIWLPPLDEDKAANRYISGYLAYSTVVQLATRLGSIQLTGQFSKEAFFAPLQPWFNPDSVRAEALGRTAIKALEKLKWKARVALFPIEPSDVPNPEPWGPATEHKLLVVETADTLFGDYEDGAEGKAEASESSSSSSAGDGVKEGPRTELQEQWNKSQPRPYRDKTFEEELIEIYAQKKRDDLMRARSEWRSARVVCKEALDYANRIKSEVLEAPTNDVPNAYAVERLHWLIFRARVRVAWVAEMLVSLEKNYTSYHIHLVMSQRLDLPGARVELEKERVDCEAVYEAAQAVLDESNKARGTILEPDQLAQVGGEEFKGKPLKQPCEDATADAGAGADEEEDQQARPRWQPEEPEELEELEELDNKVPKKRRYTGEPTFVIDADGNEAYTMEVNSALRVSKRQKRNAKKSRRSR
ncbi:hypothetical protein F5X98DRAFT_333648 [Xylaria grammica]|nr:hypothetical protein F5X98DRAFT_333648 [Xylaria grammica]